MLEFQIPVTGAVRVRDINPGSVGCEADVTPFGHDVWFGRCLGLLSVGSRTHLTRRVLGATVIRRAVANLFPYRSEVKDDMIHSLGKNILGAFS